MLNVHTRTLLSAGCPSGGSQGACQSRRHPPLGTGPITDLQQMCLLYQHTFYYHIIVYTFAANIDLTLHEIATIHVFLALSHISNIIWIANKNLCCLQVTAFCSCLCPKWPHPLQHVLVVASCYQLPPIPHLYITSDWSYSNTDSYIRKVNMRSTRASGQLTALHRLGSISETEQSLILITQSHYTCSSATSPQDAPASYVGVCHHIIFAFWLRETTCEEIYLR